MLLFILQVELLNTLDLPKHYTSKTPQINIRYSVSFQELNY